MDALFRKSDRLLANTRTDIIRDKMDDIHWNAQLISIMGAKGVGKSTLIRQYLKQNFKLGDRRVLYCSADTVDFSMRTLVGLAEEFVMRGGELLVIDSGTCITYDFLDAENHYQGGNIAPGLRLRLMAMHEHTALLPLIDGDGEAPELGYDTATALRSGVVWGIKYEIEGYIRRFRRKYPHVSVFLTGGDIKKLRISTKSSIFADDFLVPRGLNQILDYNE